MVLNKTSIRSEEKMQRPATRFLLICVVVGLIVGAFSIPFVYESQTLWYKIGLQKTMLRVGQVMGLLAFVGLIVQIFLGRRDLLGEVMDVERRIAWHRRNGVVVCCVAALHIFFVLLPEGVTNLPIGIKHWPEMVGAVLFIAIFCQVVFSLFRQKLSSAYMRWRMIHKTLGYTAICLAATHVLFVADSFAQGAPRVALLFLLAVMFVIFSTANILQYFGKE